MKKILLVFLLFVVFVPAVSSAADLEIKTPIEGETFYLGERLYVSWEPADYGVKTIAIKNVQSGHYGLMIYAQKVLDYPVTYSGSFSYKIPDNPSSLNTGNYYIEIETEDGRTYRSEQFRIVNPDNPDGGDYEKADFKLSVSQKDLYRTGKQIYLMVEAQENDGVIATSQNGFNVQYRIYKEGSSLAFDSGNAYYNHLKGAWDLYLDPIQKEGKYKVEAILYCSDISSDSYCNNRYIDDDNRQINKSFYIDVKDSEESLSIIDISPDKPLVGDRVIVNGTGFTDSNWVSLEGLKDGWGIRQWNLPSDDGETLEITIPETLLRTSEAYSGAKDVDIISDKYMLVVSNENGKTSPFYFEIKTDSDSNNNIDNFDSLFEKYGDIKFLNPKEGQNKIEQLVAGQKYTIKWENIIKYASWSVALHKFEKGGKSDFENGPSDFAGERVTELGSAGIGQTQLTVTLPSSLEPGYYYFNFGGKAAYDNSPAIEIISKKDSEKTEINKNNGQISKDTLKMIVSLLKGLHKDGSADQVIQILELIISILE